MNFELQNLNKTFLCQKIFLWITDSESYFLRIRLKKFEFINLQKKYIGGAKRNSHLQNDSG